MWFRFFDMASGGSEKTEHDVIWIEANSESKAVSIFEEKFNRNPYNVTCSCCGADYSITDYDELEADNDDFIIRCV